MLNPDKFGRRTMYCDKCDKDVEAEGVTPNCPTCGKTLFAILYIGLERITGKKFKFPHIEGLKK